MAFQNNSITSQLSLELIENMNGLWEQKSTTSFYRYHHSAEFNHFASLIGTYHMTQAKQAFTEREASGK